MFAAPRRPCDKHYFRIGAVESKWLAATAAKVSTISGRGGCDGPRATAKKTDIAIATPKLRIKAEQEMGHLFLHIVWTEPWNGGSVVQKCSTCCIFAWSLSVER